VNSWPETVALGALLLGGNASCGGTLAPAASDGGPSVGLDATRDVVRFEAGAEIDATSDASTSTDAEGGAAGGNASCMIDTSHYDQSCVIDSDCVTEVDYPYAGLGPGPLVVQSGDYCSSSLCLCQGNVIARSSMAQYVADVSRTPVGSSAVSPRPCNCPTPYYPCCLNGRCLGTCYAEELDGGTDGGVLCGLNSGPLVGNPGTEPFLVCRAPESCTSIANHWECCTSLGGGDLVTCFPPRQGDGGSAG
jgi:hypothetical protein